MKWLHAVLLVIFLVSASLVVDVWAATPNELIGRRFNPNESIPLDALYTIDYGAFVWAAFPRDSRSALSADAVSYALQLGDDIVETTQSIQSRTANNSADLHLIQLIGPPRQAWLDQIEASGLEIVQYIHPFTYVVWGNSAEIQTTRQANHVRWHAPFAPEYRLLSQSRTAATEAIYTVVAYRNADLTAAQARIGTTFEPLNKIWTVAKVSLTTEQLEQLAAEPAVFSIQLDINDGGIRNEASNQILAQNWDSNNIALLGYRAWLDSTGLSGSGVTVAVVDNGVLDSHPDLKNRLKTCVGTSCSSTAAAWHGTHVAGIVAGDNSSQATDANGFLRGQGVAPAATLVEQIDYPTFTTNNGMLTLMNTSVLNGAVISSNSWGPTTTPRGYDNNTLQVDIGVRDANATATGNQPLTYVLAIMNGNGGTSSQGTPDEAKNVITVGSTKMLVGGTQTSNISDISSNSAHGPALDGRILPDIVAPGCSVDSTYTGNSYAYACGTSMAAPHVSGSAALFIEKYRNEHASDPSPALIKAMLTATADDLTGNTDADGDPLDQRFDNKQGWGRLNLRAVISPSVPIVTIDQTERFTDTGQVETVYVTAGDPSKPVRIMLTWTDAPGHGMGGTTPAWVNDLDLQVTDANNTFLGNQINAATGWSQVGGSADNKNNTEGIFLETVTSTLQIQITASNIAGDGVPGDSDTTDQDFALVCYNCELAVPLNQATTTLIKTASTNKAYAGETLAYTVTHQILSNGPHTATVNLIDTPPAGLKVLSNSVKINGVQTLAALQSDGRVVVSSAETFTDSSTLQLTYQAIVSETVPHGSVLSNAVESSTTLASRSFTRSASATIIIDNFTYQYYFPLVFVE